MQRFVDPKKRDPYRGFNFRILLGGIEVAACRKMSGLKGSVDVVKFRAGSNRHSNEEVSPGRVHYEPVTLEQGVTTSREFEQWATQLIRHEQTPGLRAADPDFRREVEIFVYDLDFNPAAPVIKYILHRGWPSRFEPMSELSAEGNEVLFATIEIQYEGFSRVEV